MADDVNCVEFDLIEPPGRLVTIATQLRGEGKCLRVRDGHGQYGHVVVELAPHDGPSAFRFVWSPAENLLPPYAKSGVLKGLRGALAEPLEGPLYIRERADRDAKLVLTKPEHEDRYLVLVRVTVVDGSFHETDSDEEAFAIAAQEALRHALRHAELIEV